MRPEPLFTRLGARRLLLHPALFLLLSVSAYAEDALSAALPGISAQAAGNIGKSKTSELSRSNESRLAVLKNDGHYSIRLSEMNFRKFSLEAYYTGFKRSDDVFDFTEFTENNLVTANLSSAIYTKFGESYGTGLAYDRTLQLGVNYASEWNRTDHYRREFQWSRSDSAVSGDTLNNLIRQNELNSQSLVDLLSDMLQTNLGQARQRIFKFRERSSHKALSLSLRKYFNIRGTTGWIAGEGTRAESEVTAPDSAGPDTLYSAESRLGFNYSKTVSDYFSSGIVEFSVRNDGPLQAGSKFNFRHVRALPSDDYALSMKFASNEAADAWNDDCQELKFMFFRVRDISAFLRSAAASAAREDHIQYGPVRNSVMRRMRLNETGLMDPAGSDNAFVGYSLRYADSEIKNVLMIGSFLNGSGGVYRHSLTDRSMEFSLIAGRHFILSIAKNPDKTVQGRLQAFIGLK